jgi:hypothetical protein
VPLVTTEETQAFADPLTTYPVGTDVVPSVTFATFNVLMLILP